MRQSSPVRFGTVKARLPHAEAGQRIGLLGGSFNPPHAAHRLISQIALSRIGLDRVWWIVTPGNPLKDRSELAPLVDRVVAAREIADDRRIVVTGFEAGLRTTFSAATLAFLRRRYPGVQFVWIMGADCLAEFHRWRQWQDIFRLLPIAVIDRPGWRLPGMSSRAAAFFAQQRWPEARARGLAGGDTPGLDVPVRPAVAAFVDRAAVAPRTGPTPESNRRLGKGLECRLAVRICFCVALYWRQGRRG